MIDLLDHWCDRGHISSGEYDAGCRLRKVFDLLVKGGLDSRAVPQDATAGAMGALRRLFPMIGEDRKHVTIAVLCRGFTADDAVRAFGNLGIKNEDDVRFMVRASLRSMARHRWATDRETAPADIPEVVSIRSNGRAVSSVTLKV